jgi:type I restriction-modification system DNA methylase subunit
MSFAQASKRFITLVQKVHSGATARSENDLSSNLAAVLAGLGLSTVVDTGVSGGRKRPDVLGYALSDDADLVLPAEIVIESKKPHEVQAFANLADAMVATSIWEQKTFPYIRANITKVQYFVLTTFTEFAVLAITPAIRKHFVALAQGDGDLQKLRATVRKDVRLFQIAPPLPETDAQAANGWRIWLEQHFIPTALNPIPISEIHNSLRVENRPGLEAFASRLADLAAGAADDRLANTGLFQSVRANLPDRYEDLAAEVRRDLHIFLMTQNPGMSSADIELIAKENPVDVVGDFTAACIHSLIGRLFAFKAIEDIFCIRETQPLIEKERWMFATSRYDGKSATEVRTEVFAALRDLKYAAVPAIQRFAVYGFFFDWIEHYIDPILFRALVAMFASNDFDGIEGDLLGRFFEIYAQKVNRTKRKALGQYYTPLPVVELMWHLASEIVKQHTTLDQINVLDPGMGSATFLTEGARLLSKAKVPQFWDRLTGFDISAQVLGIAYVNLYVSVLSELDRNEAEQVGDLRLYATDALDPRNGQYLKGILPLVPDPDYKQFIEQRIRISAEVKRTGVFNVVIGNPPYRNNSRLALSQVAQRFPTLLKSSVANAKAQERNPRDDYAWFFAAADHYVAQRGLIIFIVSDSFAQNWSYRHFRKDLLSQYRIRHLVRLGEQVFQDVGPRISFVIIAIEKRA